MKTERWPRLQVYKSNAGNQPWRWRLVAGNGEIVCIAGEGFKTKANAERSADHICALMGVATAIYFAEHAPKLAKALRKITK